MAEFDWSRYLGEKSSGDGSPQAQQPSEPVEIYPTPLFKLRDPVPAECIRHGERSDMFFDLPDPLGVGQGSASADSGPVEALRPVRQGSLSDGASNPHPASGDPPPPGEERNRRERQRLLATGWSSASWGASSLHTG